MKLIGALTQAGAKAAKTAPFYSAVDEALAAVKRPKGTGAEFFTELTKQAGVKKAELADRKLEQAFKAKGKMTKEEAQQVLKDNPPPRLQEKLYDESTAIDEEDIREAVAQEMFGRPYDQIYNGGEQRRISDEVYRRMDDDLGTKFGKFKTKGGENYREILLRLPKTRPDASNYTDPAKYDADLRAYNASGQSDYYHPNHFTDDANIVAHMRVQDRMIPQPPQKGFYVVNNTSGRQSAMFDTPEELQAYVETLPESIRNNVTMAEGERKVPPKKVLHVEEIQSDWHQEGRKKGYRKQGQPERLKGEPYKMDDGSYGVKWEDGSVNDLGWGLDHAERLAAQGKLVDLVPDAPFKKNWHELAMKRLLNYAADNGYDSIAITPGAEQASRYDLSKQVGQISYTPSTKNLMAFDHQGNAVVNEANVKPEDLEKYLGVGVTQKLTQAGFEGPTQVLRGSDISVGGEGMKGFYDKILTDYLNNFGKAYGTQVEPLYIRGDKANDPRLAQQMGYTEEQFLNMSDLDFQEMTRKVGEKNQIPLHNFPITPQMRESIKQKGLPLYQQIGIPTAGAGAASQVPEQMQEPALEPEVKKAVGGAINFDTAPDMSDQGRMIQGAPFKRGGKVNMTTNRDTMFLELSNKKLKRK